MGSGPARFRRQGPRPRISTPSAAQVARGLNREGQGAWRRYRRADGPGPAAASSQGPSTFGYDADGE